MLDSEENLDEKEWSIIVNFLEDNQDSLDERAVWKKLGTRRIDEVAAQYPQMAWRLGTMYAAWVRDGTFNFEDCDGISVRLEHFIKSSSLDVQSECLMAMLYMGTSHNRYYVERKFMNLAGQLMPEELARRVAVEFRADDDRVCSAVRHLERSISTSRSLLHPQLVQTLNHICK
jgi:hypothetical protein